MGAFCLVFTFSLSCYSAHGDTSLTLSKNGTTNITTGRIKNTKFILGFRISFPRFLGASMTTRSRGIAKVPSPFNNLMEKLEDVRWKQKRRTTKIFYSIFANCVHVTDVRTRTFLNVNFFHQVVANLLYNVTEIEGLLKRFKIWGFLKKKDGFFGKKSIFFQNL